MPVKVDGPREDLELKGAFSRHGEDASDRPASVLAADNEMHPGGDGETRTGVACAGQEASIVSHALEIHAEVSTAGHPPHSPLAVLRSCGRSSTTSPAGIAATAWRCASSS